MTTVIQQSPGVVLPATVQYQHTVAPSPALNLNQKAANYSGYTQVGCAVISVILGVVAICIEACNANGATPIWCGVLFYLPAGLLGVYSARELSSCTIIGCMIMSILASIFSVIHFSVNIAAAFNQEDWNCGYDYENKEAKVAVNSLLTITAVVEFIVSIYASTVMCGGTSCCCHSGPTQSVTVIQTTQGTPATTQVLNTGYIAQGQPTGYAQAQVNPGITQYVQQPQMHQQQPMYHYPQQPPQYQQPPPPGYGNPPPYALDPTAKM